MEPGTSPSGQQDASGLAARVTAVMVRVLSAARPDAQPVTAACELRGLGLDSMTAARLWLAVQGECAADVPLGWLTEATTVGEYALRVAAHASQAVPVQGPAPSEHRSPRTRTPCTSRSR